MVLDVTGVQKSFRDGGTAIPVLRDVSFALGAGETLALTGESGSGKSTLLHIVGGLDAPDSGSVRVNGHDIVTLDDTARAACRRNARIARDEGNAKATFVR